MLSLKKINHVLNYALKCAAIWRSQIDFFNFQKLDILKFCDIVWDIRVYPYDYGSYR